jgi:Zn-dependent M28 family amino/carboxypeptidase
MRRTATALFAAAALLAAAAPSQAQARPTPAQVMRAVTVKRMDRHLLALQRIADRHGGNRTAGTPGYQASVDYVTRQLRRWGYRPRIQHLRFEKAVVDKPASVALLTAAGPVALATSDIGDATPGDVTATAVPVDVHLVGDRSSTSGCEAADFAGFPAGAIALVQRGTCTITEKVDNAAAAGATAVLLFNQGDTADRQGPPEVSTDGPSKLPIAGLSFGSGVALARTSTTVHVVVATRVSTIHTSNVIAQTAGNRHRVITLGGHLDSVAEGPGINDDGTGVAFLLELAHQAHRLHLRPASALRFGFWAAEEDGLHGSNAYVASLSKAQKADIAAYLNFDMLGSPNGVRYVYDANRPAGSTRLEHAFLRWFHARGLAVRPTAIGDRSDHAAFAAAGIPIGGLYSGADEVKTVAERRDFGGIVGIEDDPNYHTANDRFSNVDPTIFRQLAHAAAFVATRLALHPGLLPRR